MALELARALHSLVGGMEAMRAATLGFEASVEPLLGTLYGRALRLCRNPSDAEDLVQEAVLRAWRFWPTFEQGTNLGAWLSRILKHCFVDGHHRRRREHDVLVRAWREGLGPNSRELSTDERAISDEVAASLCALPAEYRSVVELVALEDCSYREAADRLGCPVGTVMSRLHRARRNLQSELGGFASQSGYC